MGKSEEKQSKHTKNKGKSRVNIGAKQGKYVAIGNIQGKYEGNTGQNT